MIHVTAANYLLRCLKGSPDPTTIYNTGQSAMHGYTDASFVANPDNRRSPIDCLFLLGGAPISFTEKTQNLTAQSTVEAELTEISSAAKEAVHFQISLLS